MRNIRLWDLAGGHLGRLFPSTAWRAVFSADGRYLAASLWSPVAAAQGSLECAVWEVATGREIGRLPKSAWSAVKALTPDGNAIIVETVTRVNSPELHDYICVDVANGLERWSVRNAESLFVVADGQRVVVDCHDAATGTNDVITLEAANGREVRRLPLPKNESVRFTKIKNALLRTYDALSGVSPDGRILLAFSPRSAGLDDVRNWLADRGLPVGYAQQRFGVDMIDGVTGRRLLTLPTGGIVFAPDGGSFASIPQGPNGLVELWDIPPRKPLTWFALAAAVLALPLAGLAWRRSRRLRREVA